MEITITIPTAKADEVKEAIGYQDEVSDEENKGMITNPETPKVFLENYIKNHIKSKVKRMIGRKAKRNSTFNLE